MVNKALTIEVSKGVCNFCKGEFEKAKMTQHLKYCKQRASESAIELECTPASQKARLFHILVEQNFETVDDLVLYLKETLNALPKKGVPHSREEWDAYQERYFQSHVLESLLEMVEDRSLYVPLEKLPKLVKNSSTNMTLDLRPTYLLKCYQNAMGDSGAGGR